MPGGADKQIQFNNSGAFEGSGALTWDPSINRFRANLGSYGFRLGGNAPVILFESNDDDHIFGLVGNGPALSFDATDEDFVVAANGGDLWLKGASIHLDGTVTFPGSGSFGLISSGDYIGYGVNSGLFQFYAKWKSGASAFVINNASAGLVDPINPDDIVIASTGNIHFGQYVAHQYGLYAQFNMANKSLILDDNSLFSVDASALLQLDTTTRGFLPPRLTTSEKTTISSPATGLTIYDTTLNKLCVYTGSAWETIQSS